MSLDNWVVLGALSQPAKHCGRISCAKTVEALEERINELEAKPGYRLNTNKTAAVAPSIKYLPIDENTPKGVRMILADKSQGIGYIREHQDNDGFTHWHPLPVF